MIDLSRRNFLTMLGIATASTAALSLQHVAAAIETIPLPSLDAAETLSTFVSDCFITRRGIRYPIGKLFQINVEQRYQNIPYRSGLHHTGFYTEQVALNVRQNTTAKLQTLATPPEQVYGHRMINEMMKEAYTAMKSAGDVAFSVDSVFSNGDRYAFDCAHAYPYELEIDHQDTKLSFKLAMLDDFSVLHIPAQIERGEA